MRWKWKDCGSELGLATLLDADGRVLMYLELQYLPETVRWFWLDPDGIPFWVTCSTPPS